MKITPDGKGKYIIDFEELKIDASFCKIDVSNLFNNSFVSEVCNGVWLFNSNPSPETSKSGASRRLAD